MLEYLIHSTEHFLLFLEYLPFFSNLTFSSFFMAEIEVWTILKRCFHGNSDNGPKFWVDSIIILKNCCTWINNIQILSFHQLPSCKCDQNSAGACSFLFYLVLNITKFVLNVAKFRLHVMRRAAFCNLWFPGSHSATWSTCSLCMN